MLIFFLSTKHGLEKLLKAGISKFKKHKNFFLQATRALVYFEDAEKDPMPRMIKTVDWHKIKIYFEKETGKLLKQELK